MEFQCSNLFKASSSASSTYLVACFFELPSSMSGSGDGFGDFDECDRGASSLLIIDLKIQLVLWFTILLSASNFGSVRESFTSYHIILMLIWVENVTRIHRVSIIHEKRAKFIFLIDHNILSVALKYYSQANSDCFFL